MFVPTSTKTPSEAVIPAKAGIQAVNPSHKNVENLDPRFRGDDGKYVDVAIARAFLYRLLSNLLRHPSFSGAEGFYSEASGQWESALEALPTPKKTDLATTLGKIFELIESTDEKEWIIAYEKSFGHTANSQSPAYELEYGEEHSHRQPQQLADIAAFYQAFGVTMDSRSGERVDHVSAETEFMSFLCVKEAMALENNDQEKAVICREASLLFFKEHLASWLPAFAARLSKLAPLNLLKEIAELTGLLIAVESDALQVSLGSDHISVRGIDENIDTGCMSCVLNPMAAPAK